MGFVLLQSVLNALSLCWILQVNVRWTVFWGKASETCIVKWVESVKWEIGFCLDMWTWYDLNLSESAAESVKTL